MDLIAMRDVSVSFGAVQALRDLTFSVKEGEIFGFLGPSGAGKTTAIKALTRQLRPDRGEITLFGAPAAQAGRGMYRDIGVMTDNSGVYERMTAEQNLQFFARLLQVPQARADEVLAAVGLADARGRKAKALSRGMRQRLTLARVVLTKPRLLFLDEPTSALDPATTASIHRLLRALNREGTTIFLTTHDMAEADRLCDRVAFLTDGAIRELGAPSALKLKYAQDRMTLTTQDGQCFTCAKDAQAIAGLMASLGGRAIRTFHSDEPGLEEVFLHVTGRELV